MTFMEQLQQAADAGYRQKIEDERKLAIARAAAEEQRLNELEVKIAAAMDILQPIIGRMQTAARKGETMCTAHIVPMSDINFSDAITEEDALRAFNLIGVSLRLFDLLKEMALNPSLVVAPSKVYSIQVPVLRSSDAAADF